MLTDADIQERVDEWLDRVLPTRGPDPDGGNTLAALADQWVDASDRYGPASSPARGVLLDLVREAWGLPGVTTYLREDGWRVSLGDLRHQIGAYATEIEALLAALADAPVGEATPC